MWGGVPMVARWTAASMCRALTARGRGLTRAIFAPTPSRRTCARCISRWGTSGATAGPARTSAPGAARSSEGRGDPWKALTVAAVLSAGTPGSRESALHLLDGVARALADEAERAETFDLQRDLTYVVVDVLDAVDRLLGVQA